MDVPATVQTALDDRPIAGAVCLDAGAGMGNTTAGLLAAGASRVYTVTNERGHAVTARERVGAAAVDRTAVLEADLRAVPLPDDAVEVVTAHGLFNVVPVEALDAIAAELTRVAAPGCHLVVDDYAPPPAAAAVRELFALENAAAELSGGRPALTFYPATVLRRLLEGHGWTFDRQRTLLDPVPWTADHVEAHAEVVREAAAELPAPVAAWLTAEADRLVESIGAESVGTMYSLALRAPAAGDRGV